ncbi:septal ring lytic transglycosylase RlpA family protein [Micromonospora sp. CPCC 205561]|uniref:septal ring lytic transglycosylase RlpA family protein n=1 Tax=Micromonospora sp. CPCC 205561 TaxID=3122407 RepID=UPI002FF0F9FF
MAGRHSRPRIFSSPAGIAATAAVGVALAVGGTVGAVQLTSDARPAPPPVAADLPPTGVPSVAPSGSPAASPSASASPSATASPKAARSTQAPSRGKPRTAAPKPSAAKKKSSTARPVVESGSCGASFYSEGQLTANGEHFDPSQLTAAHRTLPFDTRVRVTNPSTGRSVTVRVNDRGPFVDGRCLDLSRAAFAEIAPLDAGHVEVRYEVLG